MGVPQRDLLFGTSKLDPSGLPDAPPAMGSLQVSATYLIVGLWTCKKKTDCRESSQPLLGEGQLISLLLSTQKIYIYQKVGGGVHCQKYYIISADLSLI